MALATLLPDSPAGPAGAPHTVRLLDVAPSIAKAIPVDELDLARRAATAMRWRLQPDQDLTELADRAGVLLITGGVIIAHTHHNERVSAELLGTGDLICRADHTLVDARRELHAHTEAAVVALGRRFWTAAARWSGLHRDIHARQARQLNRAHQRISMLHQPRVEDRIELLFCELADRWGKVTPDGVCIDLQLSHQLIGELVAARRPTVTLALGNMDKDGRLTRRPDRTWLWAAPPLHAVAA